MTKQEYEAKDIHITTVYAPQEWCSMLSKLKSEYIESLEAENAALERKKEQLLEIDYQRVEVVRKLQTKVDELQTENAELRKTAVVWHKYPDDKPDVGKTFLMYWTTAYGEQTWMLEKRIDDGRHWMEKVKDVTWTYLPAPPKEES